MELPFDSINLPYLQVDQINFLPLNLVIINKFINTKSDKKP